MDTRGPTQLQQRKPALCLYIYISLEGPLADVCTWCYYCKNHHFERRLEAKLC
jgi:hypothetical protein